MKEKRTKLWAIVCKIKKVVSEWELNKKRLIIKALVLPHLDYLGCQMLLGSKKQMENFKASMRRYSRVILGLGFNVKNDFVDLQVDVNREGIWIRRLRKIKDDWKDMANFEWRSINKHCDEYIENPCREINQKNISCENQNLIVEVMNKFNRARCRDHPDRRLSQSHLLEHGIKIEYANIITWIKNNCWENLQKLIKDIRYLEKTDE